MEFPKSKDENNLKRFRESFLNRFRNRVQFTGFGEFVSFCDDEILVFIRPDEKTEICDEIFFEFKRRVFYADYDGYYACFVKSGDLVFLIGKSQYGKPFSENVPFETDGIEFKDVFIRT